MKKTVNNVLYNCISQILTLFVPLITAPYIARVLGADNLGIYSYIVSMSSLFSTIGLIGLNNYGIREIAYVKDNKYKRSVVFFELIIIRTILLLISFSVFLMMYNNTVYRVYSIVQITWFLATFLDILWYFSGIEEFKTVVTMNVIVKIVNLLLVFFLIKTKNDTVLYFLVMSLSMLSGIVVMLPHLKKTLVIPNISDIHIKKHLIPTIKIALPQMISYVYFQMDKVLLEQITHSTREVAFYDQADKLVQVPVTLIIAISAVMLPRSSHMFKNRQLNKFENTIKDTIGYSMMMIIPMMVGLAFIAVDFIPWYLGEEFLKVSYIVIALCPIILARALSSISSNQFFIATNNTGPMTISYLAAACSNVIIDLVTIPFWGSYGAVIGTIFAEYLATFIQYYFMNKTIGVGIFISEGLKYIVLSATIFIPVIIIRSFMGISIITTVLQLIVSVIWYLLLLIFTKDKRLFDIISILKNEKEI